MKTMTNNVIYFDKEDIPTLPFSQLIARYEWSCDKNNIQALVSDTWWT